MSRAIQEQGKKSKEWNYELCPVYLVSILNFRLDKKEKIEGKYMSCIQLTDIETHKVFYKKLTLVYIELPRFKKKINELHTIIEKWVFLFKNLHKLKNLPDIFQSEIFKKLFEEAEIANMTPQKFKKYCQSLKNLRNMNLVINEYKNTIARMYAENARILAEKEYFQQAIAEKEYAFQQAITEKEHFQQAIAEKDNALQKALAELAKYQGNTN